MAVELILSTDTLGVGFRQKANESFGAIIVSADPQIVSGVFSGVIRLTCQDGSFINLDLTPYYYTQTQITLLLSAITSSPYSGAWNSSFTGGYGTTAVVDHNGNFWRSNNNSNTDEPGTSSKWSAILTQYGFAVTIPATTAIPYFLNAASYIGSSKDSEIITKVSFKDPTTGASTGKPVRVYDIPVPEQDTNNDGTGTFTGWNIYGYDNGSGQFSEDTFITIKI